MRSTKAIVGEGGQGGSRRCAVFIRRKSCDIRELQSTKLCCPNMYNVTRSYITQTHQLGNHPSILQAAHYLRLSLSLHPQLQWPLNLLLLLAKPPLPPPRHLPNPQRVQRLPRRLPRLPLPPMARKRSGEKFEKRLTHRTFIRVGLLHSDTNSDGLSIRL
jgi:hypothetical protein